MTKKPAEDPIPNLPQPKRGLVWWGIVSVLVVVILCGVLLVWSQTASAPTPEQAKIVLKTPKVELKLFATGLNTPTDIAAIKNVSDLRLFVLEQPGTIRIIQPDGKLTTQPFLDITSKVLNLGEMGLLGITFHPKYQQNGYFYINYVNKAQETIIARYTVAKDQAVADINSEKVLIRLPQPYTNHNGGALQFGPDGYLYIVTGDGGGAGDPGNRAQNKSSLFGKILRIDVDQGDPYANPPTNPFKFENNSKPEIWAYGLRNAWRISFDSLNGDLYIADVGQNELEEVNLQPAASKGGENYGWRCYEGTKTYNTNGCQDQSKYTKPIFEYNHQEERCSIAGGFIYRGSDYPTLDGKYFYGDYCSGQLYYSEQKGDKWMQTLAAKTPYAISSFGQNSEGELFVADINTGNIYRIIDSAK